MATGPFDRGHVVHHPAAFKNGGRPYMVLSSAATHPFHGEEYLVAGCTTTEREQAIALPETVWTVGQPAEPTWVSPWYLMTLKHANIEYGVGEIEPATVDRVARAVARQVGLDV